MPRPGTPAQRWRHWRPRLAGLLLLAAVGALPRALVQRPQEDAPAQSGGGGAAPSSSAPAEGLAAFLRDLEGALEPLRRQVQDGKLVPRFGEKADEIVRSLAGRAGEAAPELERAADGALQALFLRQLALLRQQLAAKFVKAGKPEEAAGQADRAFMQLAAELQRPGSDWSVEHERYTLRAVLEGTFRREAALEEEQAAAARAQQSTVEIVSKLQNQMEAMQQKVQAMRAGAPWFLSTSYRIPKTPFQLIGRYQQGRANVELSLNPDRDPANAEAGFVDGFGPMNIGLSLNLGM